MSSLSLARLCLLSSCNESRCAPHRRNLKKEISHISPKTKNAYWQIVFMGCPCSGQAVDFINLPSCRAGTYFRYAAKVSKDAPNEEKGNKVALENRSGGFPLPFEIPLPFDRSRFASAHKCGGGLQIRYRGVVPATLAWLQLESLTARRAVLEFDCVRFLAADALGASVRRPNRGYMSGHCPPGAVDEWEK